MRGYNRDPTPPHKNSFCSTWKSKKSDLRQKATQLANGTPSAGNIGVASAWLTSPLEDEPLLKHLEAILAHEFAHVKLSHLPKRVWTSLCITYASQLFLLIHELGKIARKKNKAGSAPSLWRAYYLYTVFSWALKHRIEKSLARFQEFQADAYAAHWTSPRQVADALEFLKEDFGSAVYNDPIIWMREGSKASYPAMNLRIQRMRKPGIENKRVWTDRHCWLSW